VTDVARIHYEIDDDLHRRAKSAAALQGITLKAFLEQALEAATAKAGSTGPRARKAK
jgi:predicted HicB family RNase H-like nuclease